MENLDETFSIEEVVLPSRKEAPSGCELCQHCFLLRGTFLEKVRHGQLMRRRENSGMNGSLSHENEHKE